MGAEGEAAIAGALAGLTGLTSVNLGGELQDTHRGGETQWARGRDMGLGV